MYVILSEKLTSDARSAIMEIDIAQTSALSPFQIFDDILQSESRLSKQYVCFGDEEENMAEELRLLLADTEAPLVCHTLHFVTFGDLL